MSVLFETSLGDIVIDLEVELCPKSSENFLKLCKIYYYNLNAFFNGQFLQETFRNPLKARGLSVERLSCSGWRPKCYWHGRRVGLVVHSFTWGKQLRTEILRARIRAQTQAYA